MPVGPHIFALIEEALNECLMYHAQLDQFLLRCGLSEQGLAAARQRATARKGRWETAPKRFVVQEVLKDIGTGRGEDDKLVAEIVTALCRIKFPDASKKGQDAIEGLKAARDEESKAAADRLEQQRFERESARRVRDSAAEAKAAQRTAFRERFLNLANLKDDPQARGYALETLLNDFFSFEEMNPRGSFKIVGEQVDGSFSWSGLTYLVEAKWTSAPVSANSFGAFDWKIQGKTVNTRGLFIAVNGYSAQAIKGLNGKGSLRFVCIDGAHLVRSFEYGFPQILEVVWRHADETGESYLPVASEIFQRRVS